MRKLSCHVCGIAICVLSAGAVAEDYSTRPEVRAYIDQLVVKHSFDRDELTRLFKSVERQSSALKAMDRQAEAKPWYQYRTIFVNHKRVNKGISFWRMHADLLARIEREYLVPAHIVLAIAGVETYYGVNFGGFPVLDALVTLGFDYPRRAVFFRKELTEMLLLGREEGLAYNQLQGSFSGALGLSQFMPSSYRYYAVDFDRDGKRNLWHTPDALASIANYLARHGWKHDGAITNRITMRGARETLPLNKAIKPWLSRADAASYGIKSISGLADGEPLFSVLSYELADGEHEYWAGYHNFYVISRYNHSRRYAMAVYQLAEILKQRYLGE